MSGHSKWSTIKHKKGAADAKRGKVFSKIIKEIMVAARIGGGDPDANPRLRTMIEKAKGVNMPNDNVVRAIKKGTGELEGVNYEEITYEGYGPGGAALLIACLTDNTKRTVSEVRHLLSKHGGSLGETGCVAWMFDNKGTLTFEKATVTEDQLMESAVEAGADDIADLGDAFEVSCEPSTFDAVKAACDAANLIAIEATVQMVPKNTVKLEGADAERMLKLMDTLDDHDDVQNVSANFDIDDAVLESMA